MENCKHVSYSNCFLSPIRSQFIFKLKRQMEVFWWQLKQKQWKKLLRCFIYLCTFYFDYQCPVPSAPEKSMNEWFCEIYPTTDLLHVVFFVIFRPNCTIFIFHDFIPCHEDEKLFFRCCNNVLHSNGTNRSNAVENLSQHEVFFWIIKRNFCVRLDVIVQNRKNSLNLKFQASNLNCNCHFCRK